MAGDRMTWLRRPLRAGAVVLGLLCMAPTIALATGETLVISPTSGGRNTVITATFRSSDAAVCGANDRAIFLWDGQQIGPAVVLGKGRGGCSAVDNITTPPDQPSSSPNAGSAGPHRVEAQAGQAAPAGVTNPDPRSDRPGATFTLVAAPASPGPGATASPSGALSPGPTPSAELIAAAPDTPTPPDATASPAAGGDGSPKDAYRGPGASATSIAGLLGAIALLLLVFLGLRRRRGGGMPMDDLVAAVGTEFPAAISPAPAATAVLIDEPRAPEPEPPPAVQTTEPPAPAPGEGQR
ncbi:MAG: hypothetical protein ACYDGR_01475, partial [Candidatus Dormibacteria bacterium]